MFFDLVTGAGDMMKRRHNLQTEQETIYDGRDGPFRIATLGNLSDRNLDFSKSGSLDR